jgi:hypothetical protein
MIAGSKKVIRKECDKKEKMRYKCGSYRAKERRNEEEEKNISPGGRML